MLSEYDNGNDDGGDVCIVLGWLDSVIYAKHLVLQYYIYVTSNVAK